MIQKSDFFGYDSYTISSERLSVRVMTLGATVIDFRFDGRPVALRFETAQEYLDSDAYLGAIVGRYANRIGGARFTLNGKTYELPANEGKNQLHGGKNSYDRRIWDAEVCGDSAVRFRLFSPDGDNGYPGNLSIAVTYTVAGDRMRIDFEGDCDADTYFAPTTHLYFNLGGAPTVLDTRLAGEIRRTAGLLAGKGHRGLRRPLLPAGRRVRLPRECRRRGDGAAHGLPRASGLQRRVP